MTVVAFVMNQEASTRGGQTGMRDDQVRPRGSKKMARKLVLGAPEDTRISITAPITPAQTNDFRKLKRLGPRPARGRRPSSSLCPSHVKMGQDERGAVKFCRGTRSTHVGPNMIWADFSLDENGNTNLWGHYVILVKA